MLWVLKKNRLDETVILSTQNICFKLRVRKYLQFYTENFCLSKPMFISFKVSSFCVDGPAPSASLFTDWFIFISTLGPFAP